MESVTLWLDSTGDAAPDRLAVCDAADSYTWGEYCAKARAIARELIAFGLCCSPVAVFFEKSAKVPICFAGCAYARCFYSPIDVTLPDARRKKMLDILQPAVIITERKYAEQAASFGVPCLVFEDISAQEGDAALVSAVQRAASKEDLLYVLFTSGSTGEPKGVSITHRSVINYITWVARTFSVTKTDSFANQAPFYFDNSILDIYTTMKTGASLHITPRELFSQPVRLLEYLRDAEITTIFWVPSALIGPARLKAFRNVALPHLKRVLFCGEVMPVKQLNVWRAYMPGVLYANLYGPTEITDACTCYIVDRAFSDDESLPIGRPVDNCEVFLLDGDSPVPQGKEGEICVRGVCLSPGYYRNPAKTAEVFVQNPLTTEKDIIYRTGDIGKINTLGELMYSCRKDAQIKHLGHRIEPGEIDTAASSIPGVESCCTVYDDRRRKIVLFIEGAADEQAVVEKLAGLLPEYMIPAKIIIKDSLPRTLNGKIDRKHLMELMK